MNVAPRLRDTLSRGFLILNWMEAELIAQTRRGVEEKWESGPATLSLGRLAELRRAPAAGGWEYRASKKGGVIARIEILQWSGLNIG